MRHVFFSNNMFGFLLHFVKNELVAAVVAFLLLDVAVINKKTSFIILGVYQKIFFLGKIRDMVGGAW